MFAEEKPYFCFILFCLLFIVSSTNSIVCTDLLKLNYVGPGFFILIEWNTMGLFFHIRENNEKKYFVLVGSDEVAWNLAYIPWCYFLYEFSSQRAEGWKKRCRELLSLFLFVHSADKFVICSTLQRRVQHFHQCPIQLKVNLRHDSVPCWTPMINQSINQSSYLLNSLKFLIQ